MRSRCKVSIHAFLTLLLILTACSALRAEPTTDEGIIEYYIKERMKPADARRHPTLIFGDGMKVGHVGVLPYDFDQAKPQPFVDTTIHRILADDAMVLSVTMHRWVRTIRGSLGRETVGPPKPVEDGTTFVLIRGVDTRGQVDGKRIGLSDGFRVSGTEKIGETTVYVLKPRSLIELETPEEQAKTDAK